MTFVVPQGKTHNSAIANLLDDCFKLGNRVQIGKKSNQKNSSEVNSTMRKNLTNPFANCGMNAYFSSGFQKVYFMLSNPAKKDEKKEFQMTPKYVQI